MKNWICFFLVLIIPLLGITQKREASRILLEFKNADQTKTLPKTLQQPYFFQDTLDTKTYLNHFIDSLRQTSFLTASVDSLILRDSTYEAYLYLGKSYDAFSISNGNVEVAILKKIGSQHLLDKPIRYQQLKALQENLLKHAENNGYPFATVQLKNVIIQEEKVYGDLFWDKGKLIRLADIKINGEGNLKTAYLAHYLGLKKGNIYQKNKIKDSAAKLAELPFMKETRPPSILFKNKEANINLFLDPKPANRFDFLIGVLPNNQETGKVLITGNINAEFQNQFGKGEYIHFEFEQLRPETQQLELENNLPYLFNTPLGLDFKFGLYKRDSTYRDLIWNIGVQYLFEGNNYLKAFSKNTASALLSVDENMIIRSKQLPQNLDFRYNAFGLAYQLEKLDYRFNPRTGWLLQLEGSAGFKTININSKIAGLEDAENLAFDFARLYDNLDLHTFQFQLKGKIDKYIPIRKRNVLKLSIQGASIFSETPILRNEQFRLGGNKRLRGFDEESIFASTYGIASLEFRYLISQNSYFFLFGDGAYIKNKTNELDFSNQPIGIGAGMTFETKAGIFGISYALGKLDGEAFEFRKAKVHFGFVSLF